jgi:hypothetical protein
MANRPSQGGIPTHRPNGWTFFETSRILAMTSRGNRENGDIMGDFNFFSGKKGFYDRENG